MHRTALVSQHFLIEAPCERIGPLEQLGTVQLPQRSGMRRKRGLPREQIPAPETDSLRLATLVYRTLRSGQNYVKIGEKEYESRFKRQRRGSLKAAAKSLGYQLVETCLNKIRLAG